jgi:aspartate racemase
MHATGAQWMKTIGLIGGMSWESSAEYYRMLNRYSKALHGGHHNAKSVMVTVDFAEIEALQRAHDWPALGERMAAAARQLEAAGAQLIVLTTNTMHRVHAAIEDAVALPFLHIADPTGVALRDAGVARVGLLGTRYTMELPFYAEQLRDKFGLDVLVPDERERDDVHRIIYDELCHGVVAPESRATYVRIIEQRDFRAGGDTRLHGNHAADPRGGFAAAGVRYDRAACAGGGRVGRALTSGRGSQRCATWATDMHDRASQSRKLLHFM